MKTRNLEALRRLSPRLCEELSAHEPSSELVFGDDGGPDVVIGGRPVYGGDYAGHVAEQMKAFWGGQRHIDSTPPEPGWFDQHTNRFLGRFLSRLGEEDIAVGEQAAGEESFYLIVLGPGLGGQIDELVEATNCQAVIFADQTLDFICHSLETYDWRALVDRMSARGGRLIFVIEETAQDLSGKIATAIRVINPCSLDNTTFYVDRTSPFMIKAVNQFVQHDFHIITIGLGFFNDENLMLRNAHANFKSGEAKVFERTDERVVEVPVFIVASGPSVDECIPHIKANADKAIVVSCGTGLKPLLANGITPDFHVEGENIAVSPVLTDVSGEHDISSVCLIGAATVECGATEYFSQTVHYFRPGFCPFPLFSESDNNCLRFPSPNVANSGFSFAQDIGAKSVYLFGVDLGVKDGDGQHHSAHSYYYTDDAIIDPEDLKYTIPVPGNFGGTVYSSAHLHLTGRQLASAIRNHGGNNRYFNCSDGALIEGMAPHQAEAISLPEIEGGKARVVKELIDSFPVLTKKQFDEAWDPEGLEVAFGELAGDIADSVKAVHDGGGKAYIGPLVGLLHPEDYLDSLDLERLRYTAVLYLRGSLFTMIGAAEYYLNHIADPGQLAKVKKVFEQELNAAVEGLRSMAMETVRDPVNAPIALPTEAGQGDDFIPEVPYTWGKVPRNALCPCGSGKRYKKCHGEGVA